MKLDKIKSFIQLAKDEGVSELKFEENGLKLEVSFNSAQAVPLTQLIPQASSTSIETTSSEDGHNITSPLVGTFYESSSPTAKAYVEIGQKVKVGQTLCIIEAMKIMNEIESDVSGTIIDIKVENESLVEFGQNLFVIKKG